MTAPSPALSPTLELACELIRRPSVTPVDEGCQDLMMRRLAAVGFTTERMRIEEVCVDAAASVFGLGRVRQRQQSS